MTLPIRRASRPRQPGVRRASPRLAARRIAAAVVAIAAATAIYGAATSPAFQLRHLDVEGARYTDRAAIAAALGLRGTAHPNVFALDTARLDGEMLALPAITSADVRVALPDRLVVRVAERRPVLIWAIAGARWLVDVDGVVMAPAPSGGSGGAAAAALANATPGPSMNAVPGTAAASASGTSPRSSTAPVAGPDVGDASSGAATTDSLPVFVDDRSGRQPLAPGAVLDPLDLAVARRLGAVTPALAGSRAATFTYAVTDADGYVVAPQAAGSWRAVFGIYTPTLRPPDLVPSQVQCLASLLRQVGERKVATVYLFPEGDECGTYSTK